MLGTLEFAIAMRCGDSRAIPTLGKFTALAMVPSSRKARSWSTTMNAQFSSASSVEAPRCGSAITPGWPASRALGKSVTYFFRCLCASASITASSSTMASRAKLRSTRRGRASARRLASISPRVLSTSGRCSVTKSAPLMTSSMEAARFTAEGRRQALSTVISGSKPTTFMPSLIAVSATRPPTAPNPITPSVRPGSSKPANCFLPSSTRASKSSPGSNAFTYATAGTTFLAAASIAANTSSFTALALAPGALNTGTPRCVIAATGMLFTPVPARPTAFTPAAISATCRAWERSRIASGDESALPTI